MAFSVYEVVCVACQLRIWFVNYATDKPARGTSVQFWLTCFRGTRLSCTQNAFLHISTDFWVLWRFWREEHDYNTVPFERRFITQSLCKCDRSLSRESIRKSSYFEFLFFVWNRWLAHFSSSCSWGVSNKSRKEIFIDCWKSVFWKFFPEL